MIPLSLFALGFAFVFRRWIFDSFDGVFGDDADGEILLAVIEHWNHVLHGSAHWSDPTYFYPQRGVLGYGDALFLYGIAAAAIRLLGFDAFTSFMIAMAALAAVGFFGFLRLARRHFHLSVPPAAIGAFVFAFANMNAVALIHAQTYCAMLLPLVCDLVLTAWKDERRIRAALLAFAAGLLHALIFFTAFQTAWFFGLLLILCAIGHPIVFGPAATLALLKDIVSSKLQVAIGYTLGLGVGLAPFAIVYAPVLLAGRHRELSEVFSNSPDARDIVNVTTGNWVWGDLLQMIGVTGRPNRPWWEVDRGYTPAMLVVVLGASAGLMLARWRGPSLRPERDRWLLVTAFGAALSFLLQLDYVGLRPWTLVWTTVPGAGAIRYTFRFQLVANLAAALLLARGFLALQARARRQPRVLIGGLAAAVLVMAEQLNLDWPATLSRDATLAEIAAIPPPPAKCRVFYLVPGVRPRDRAGWIHNSQATLLSQMRNIPTINGYATWQPEGWDLEEPVKPGYAAAIREWATARGVTDLCGLDPSLARWKLGLP